jgi:hypothetical protein
MPERRPAPARVPAMLAPLGDGSAATPEGPADAEPMVAGQLLLETPKPAPVAPVIDLRAYAGRRSA